MALEKIRPYLLTTAAETPDEAWLLIDNEDAVEKTTVKALRRAPSMTKTARNALASPGNGDIIYQTDNTPGFRFYVEGAWQRIAYTADP